MYLIQNKNMKIDVLRLKQYYYIIVLNSKQCFNYSLF
jgi:hypothetical protein